MKEVQQYKKDVETAMVAANNHYAGFGPETSNMFREMLGLKRTEWGIDKDIPRMVEYEQVKDHRNKAVKQNSIADFISK